MDLSKIMSISGKSGLFRLVAHTKSGAIVESLADKKRFPVFTHDRMSSLEEISVFTTDEDMPLKEVLNRLKTHTAQGSITDPKAGNSELQAQFAEVVPEFDKDRVYVSDIRKILGWFLILQEQDLLTDEEAVDEPSEAAAEEAGSPETMEDNNELAGPVDEQTNP